MDKFGDAPIKYSVSPSDLTTTATTTNKVHSIKETFIEINKKKADPNIEKSKEELEDFAPLTATADFRIDESKDKSGVYLIQTWARKVRCKKLSCNHVWYYKGKRDHTLCPSCYTSVDIQTQMVK